MNVLMISPGFPVEQPYFTRGLASVGARVIGMGDQPEGALPPMTREAVSAYFKVNFADEDGMIAEAQRIASQIRIDRVECLPETLGSAKLWGFRECQSPKRFPSVTRK